MQVLRAQFSSKPIVRAQDFLRFTYRVSLSARHCAGVLSRVNQAIDEGWRALVSLDLGFNSLENEAVRGRSVLGPKESDLFKQYRFAGASRGRPLMYAVSDQHVMDDMLCGLGPLCSHCHLPARFSRLVFGEEFAHKAGICSVKGCLCDHALHEQETLRTKAYQMAFV